MSSNNLIILLKNILNKSFRISIAVIWAILNSIHSNISEHFLKKIDKKGKNRQTNNILSNYPIKKCIKTNIVVDEKEIIKTSVELKLEHYLNKTNSACHANTLGKFVTNVSSNAFEV